MRFNRYCVALWWAALAVILFLAFDDMMQQDAKRLCAKPSATVEVCRQAYPDAFRGER